MGVTVGRRNTSVWVASILAVCVSGIGGVLVARSIAATEMGGREVLDRAEGGGGPTAASIGLGREVPLSAERTDVVPVGDAVVTSTAAPGGTTDQREDRLTVAVVGDSMFEVGAAMIRAVIEHTAGVALTHWEAISGRAISDHPSALSTSADVIVTSFAYNDVAIHGWPEARAWLVRFLETHADSQIVWVQFAAGTSPELDDYYQWLTQRAESLENLHIIDFSELHRDHGTWSCGDPCGGLGFHLQPTRGGVAVLASMIRSQLEGLVRQH